ncbi:Mitochondrial distribution and morphology protein 12 [Marasmius tenuissimus]|uniref:1-phosphatidylinositol-3-phosphate 5-kinase n=1 Tax=Marasmius tenuissimus TaxID=585030 RepID=A0ABR3A0M1_9AGAR
MNSPQVSSPVLSSFSGPASRSRSSTKLADDITSLTSFNPFSEEDENDQSSYTLVTSLFSRVKNTFSAPLSSAVAAASNNTTSNAVNGNNNTNAAATNEPRRPPYTTQTPSSSSRNSTGERPNSLATVNNPNPAPPLVSLTPAQPEVPTYNVEYDRSPSRTGMLYSESSPDGGIFGNTIPGFPIQDDARSIKTSTGSLHRSGSVSKVIRRIRGEGLSRDYWMDDENAKECYDCKSVFTTWRRKHHCRICGQIFCSRCASNIIKGSRFGHEGMVRVCNLCVEKLAKVDDDDDDDRRSVISSVTFPAHQFSSDSMNLAHHPQSPFAASQLFGRDEPFNLYSIAETKRPISGSDDSGFGSRPHTPFNFYQDRNDPVWEHEVGDNPAPFRRALSDDEKDINNLPTTFADESPTAPGSKTPIEFPSMQPSNGDATSSIQFPTGSPERGPDSAWPSELGPHFDFDAATPFIRSRVQSRLDNLISGEPGWRTRRESTAYAQELNLTSMLHLKIMLRQMLSSENIPNMKEWEDTLLKLALRIARELTFTASHRQGEDMDVRRYVKIKKVPGGTPQDSEYVDGAVITKNVAHKQMSRSQKNPRVMLVTFPLEFSRVEGQYMHFGQIVRQEKEYLGNLSARIAALRPHVILVEKSVSRIALESLLNYNIAVARTVRPSAIQLIARMTQADVFSSMDKLALEPRLGHCQRFRVQTFDHPLIPGRRKTFMRFEGCSRDMGCTIILRGENIDTLKRIKKVTRFLTFIVRNLKLETHLWKDSVITLPSFNADAVPVTPGRLTIATTALNGVPTYPSSLSTPSLMTAYSAARVPTPAVVELRTSSAMTDDVGEDDLPDEEAQSLKLSKRIDQSLEPYLHTFLSVSATLRFPPPYPIMRMKELDGELSAAKRAWEDEIIQREERSSKHTRDETITSASQLTVTESTAADRTETLNTPTHLVVDEGDIKAQIEALPQVNFPNTPSLPPSPYKLEESSGYFSFQPNPNSGNMVTTPGPMYPVSAMGSLVIEQIPLKVVEDISAESNYSLVKWKHEEFRRIWEWYLRKNHDDFVVEKYQCISLVEYTVPIADFGEHRACFPPRLTYITFYGENDCTLGQYIEKTIADTLSNFLDPKAICTGKGCDQSLARHCRVFVHNETRLFVAVEGWDGQFIGRTLPFPAPDLITTWSACRVCGSATPFIPVSEEMQRYSFAKFLELHFYPADVKLVQGAGCQHNIYQHHIRYFASRGMTVRFQTDPIILHEVIYPPFRIRIRPEVQLEMKNNDYQRLRLRNLQWYSGLVDDLKLISIEAAIGDEKHDAALLASINILIARAEMERQDVDKLINQVYKDSAPTDTLALNQVRATVQDKIVAWQQDFDRLPKPKPVNNLDRNSKRASAFGSVRAMWPRRYDLSGAFDHYHLPSTSVSEAEEGPLASRRVTGDSFTSSASDASEPEPDTEPKRPKPEEEPITDKPPTDSPEEYRDARRTKREDNAEAKPEKEGKSESDGDSDSTIGAGREPGTQEEPSNNDKTGPLLPKMSRLPRRTANQPSVADLVRKYQDFLPAQGVQELAKTAFPPHLIVSESEQEYSSPIQHRNAPRHKMKHRQIVRKGSASDFEQGYAANVAPRYLTHSRRSLAHAQATNNNRLAGPSLRTVVADSDESSRRPSPEKKSSGGKGKERRPSRPSSPNPGGKPSTVIAKGPKPRIPSRTTEKTPARPPAASSSRSAFRRPPTTTGGKVSNIAKHFERLGRDTERSKSRYNIIRGRRARPVASAKAKVEVLDSVHDAIKDESECSDSSSEADDEGGGDDERKTVPELIKETESPQEATAAPPVAPEVVVEAPTPVPDSNKETEAQAVPSESIDVPTSPLPPLPNPLPPSPFLGPSKAEQSDAEIPTGTERHSILKALSGLWTQPPPSSRNSLENDELMMDPEHIFRDSSMVVRTDEPTSIIALALNSPQYREMLAKSRADKRTNREARLTEGEAFMPDDRSVADSTSTWGVVNVETSENADPTEDLRVPSSKLPWAITFESGGLIISCTVLYPEQFDALRRTYDCERSMIESLSRCVKWNATGGKSGSAFLKTGDDRFIAKELSRPELQTMETFAPAYFDYMSSSVSSNRPTLLAKVFGCYKLTFKKTEENERGHAKVKSTQMNLLVMENLFYDRRFSKIYDLKGSTRNRHVQSTGRENEVLLDENLVQTAHRVPFYLREHSKRILRGALYNDSKFLADINVMDYSLVCGVDSQNNELVVGIVDYIRTYTWDKKLESWVKESAFMGGGRGEPTIVSPKQYRQRFISAMERYFPLVPDRWMKQKDTPEEDPNSLSELWPDW